MSDTITLPARVDLSAVGQVVTDLRATAGDVIVDAGQVNHLGALGLQALISAARTVAERGNSFRIIGSSDRVLEQMKIMGTAPEILSGDLT